MPVKCSLSQAQIKFDSGSIKAGCLDRSAPGYDQFCLFYQIHYSDANQIKCTSCVSGYTLVYSTAASMPKCYQDNTPSPIVPPSGNCPDGSISVSFS
jgi:hypothetical protein